MSIEITHEELLAVHMLADAAYDQWRSHADGDECTDVGWDRLRAALQFWDSKHRAIFDRVMSPYAATPQGEEGEG